MFLKQTLSTIPKLELLILEFETVAISNYSLLEKALQNLISNKSGNYYQT